MKEFEVTFLGEEQLDSGDYLMTFEIPEWVDKVLKKKYGKEDYTEELSKDFCDYVTNYLIKIGDLNESSTR